MTENVPESAIAIALEQFGAAEANLEKLERIFGELCDLTPDGIVFGSNSQYEDLCRDYEDVLAALPEIDGWKPESQPIDLNSLAHSKLDAAEVGEPIALFYVQETLEAPSRELSSYRRLLNKKRRQLIRDELSDVIADVDRLLRDIGKGLACDEEPQAKVSNEQWDLLKDRVQIMDTLLGSILTRPKRWADLERHLYFGQVADLQDIMRNDWPEVKKGLIANLYHENEPIPVATVDLGTLAATNPRGAISTKLNWSRLDEEDFERFIFTLISNTEGYENPQWLMRTNAQDRGRDLSVDRVWNDNLGGVTRKRVLIQCKRIGKKSINANDVALLSQQILLWEPPRVDVLVIATTSRFTEQAVAAVERNNDGDRALSIEMWPESHLERLLASRPTLVAQFKLR